MEPTGEYFALFQLYDPEESGFVDWKATTLGMLNFVEGMDKQAKCDFVFRIGSLGEADRWRLRHIQSGQDRN